MKRRILDDLGSSNSEIIAHWEHMMLENFDNFYDYVLLENFDENTPDGIINVFETYDTLVFGTDQVSRLKFCWKMIQRVKNNKKNGLEDYPKIARELLSVYTKLWHETKLFMESEISLDKIIEEKKAIDKTRKSLSFKDLFKDKQKADDLKKIFKKFGYLDENYNWIGQTGAKNELAIAYYVLREPAFDLQLIKLGHKKPQLITFYQEFGLQVSEKSDESAYTSIRNLTSEPTRNDIHEIFKELFKPLLKIKK